MRHAEVAYFDEHGDPVNPTTVLLTDEGRAPGARRRGRRSTAPCSTSCSRRGSSGRPRRRGSSRAREPERWPELNEMGGRPAPRRSRRRSSRTSFTPGAAGHAGRSTASSAASRSARCGPASRRRSSGSRGPRLGHLPRRPARRVNRALLSYALVPGGAPLPRRGSSRRPAASTSSTSARRLDRAHGELTFPTTRSIPRATTTMERYWRQCRRKR